MLLSYAASGWLIKKLALHDTILRGFAQRLMRREGLQQHFAAILACLCFGVLLRTILLPGKQSPCGKVRHVSSTHMSNACKLISIVIRDCCHHQQQPLV